MKEKQPPEEPEPGVESGAESVDHEDHGEEIEREIGDLTETLASQKPPSGPSDASQFKATSFLRSWPVAIVALLFSIALTVVNLAGWGPFQRVSEQPTQREYDQKNELELLALVGYIEDYRVDHGQLPDAVEQLGIDLGDRSVEYEVFDEGDFVVTLINGPVVGSYDSRRQTSGAPSVR